jgi:hypothetical protein
MLPCPFSHLIPSPTGTNTPQPQDLFWPPVLWFYRRKKWYFCLLKITTQGFSLWHFRVNMYYSLNWFVSIFLLSTLVPCGSFNRFKNSILILVESISTIFTILTSFFYTPLKCDLPLMWPVFLNIAVFALGPYSTYEKKHATFGLLNLVNFN